jgi:3-phosphoglycerate kinase
MKLVQVYLEVDKVELAKQLLLEANGKIVLGKDIITGLEFNPETKKMSEQSIKYQVMKWV